MTGAGEPSSRRAAADASSGRASARRAADAAPDRASPRRAADASSSRACPRRAADAAPDRASPRPDGERPLRLFVALDLPAAARDALAAVGAAADPDVWRAVPPQSLHVTLAFLGSRPPADVAAIEPIVAGEDGGPAPRLALADALLLPPRRARVLTIALDDPDGTLRALQSRISQALAAAGVYTPEKRPFRAHITVARLRPRVRPPRAAGVEVEALAFPGEAVTLYVSRLHPSGARYEPLARAGLCATGG